LSNQRIFQIERFYFGTLIQDGQAVGTPSIVANSSGVTVEQVQNCLKIARVKPPDIDITSDDMPSTLGYFRGDYAGYFITKSQRTANGFPQLLYLLLPDMALRWLGGNYSLFQSLGFEEMRAFSEIQRDLAPLSLEDPQPFTEEDQVELLYDLFYYAGDDIKNVEGLMAALVNGQRIAVLNAPLSLKTRLGFIEGLLMMLPAPARVGMSWVTHASNIRHTSAQITFVSTDAELDDCLVYDWRAGKLLTDPPPDNYSRFIASRLRLDASMVIESTTSIARTAVWRAMRKESLAQALHFASRRAAVDSAVRNNQPADHATVAGILRQDPTLPDDMRLLYAQHLLAFTLALNEEMEHADVLPMVAAANRVIAEAIYLQLRDVAESDEPLAVIDLVERWVAEVPQAKVIPWQQIAYIAAVTYLGNALDAGRVDDAVELLLRMRESHPALKVEDEMPQLIELAQSSAAYDADLALLLFVLACEFLPVRTLQQVIADPQLVGQLPERIQYALYYLQSQARNNPPDGLLINVIGDLADEHRLLVVGRLADIAISLGRDELVDAQVLEAVLRTVQSSYAARFAGLMEYLAERYSKPQMLQRLAPDALELLPQLYFVAGRFEHGVRLLEYFQANVFRIQNLDGFIEMMGNLFLNARLPIESVEPIFALIEHSRLRPEPRTRAYCAALIASRWAQSHRNLARRLTVMLYNDTNLLGVIGVENGIDLLTYHASLGDPVSIWEVGSVLLTTAVDQERRGVDLMMRIAQKLERQPGLSIVATELLRQYVRMIDRKFAKNVPAYFGHKLKEELGSELAATYVMRETLVGADLLDYADVLNTTSVLLADIASTYHASKEPPPRHRIRQGLDSMSGGLDANDRESIARNLERIAQLTFQLGQKQVRRRNNRQIETAIFRGELVPETPLDFLLYLGGRFSNAEYQEVDLARSAMSHLFGLRSATMLLEETSIAVRLLEGLLRGFALDDPPDISLRTLNSEMDSLWGQLSLYNQRQSQPMLGADTQALVQLISHMSQHVKENVFKNTNLENGQQIPRSEIEALRWVGGYFARKHQA
jgi:hypothetical protein